MRKRVRIKRGEAKESLPDGRGSNRRLLGPALPSVKSTQSRALSIEHHSHPRPIDTDHGLLYFLTLYGDAAPQGPIHFKWFSHTTQWSYPALETIEFDANAMLGKLGDPFILHFEKGVEADVIGDGGLVAYPNPFRDELTIHWHGTEQVVELRIEDASGRLIDILDCDHLGAGPCRWNATAAESGMYVIHAITEDRSYSVRVIK